MSESARTNMRLKMADDLEWSQRRAGTWIEPASVDEHWDPGWPTNDPDQLRGYSPDSFVVDESNAPSYRQPWRPWAFLSNPAWVSRTPVITSILLDGGAFGQIARMMRERTAAGQSLTSWCMVVVALLLWSNWFRVITPGETWARRMQAFSVAVNIGVVLTIVYFRYFL